MTKLGSKTPLWLDCDTGHDDAFALLLAAHHPSLELLGVSTIYGNASLAHTTYNTLAILTAIERPDIPVYVGAAKPFCRGVACAPDIHGETGLDGTTCLPKPARSPREDKTAIQAMYDSLISQPPRKAWLVVTGSLTNAALLFALHPDLADHIAGLSVMGGAIGNNFTSAPLGKISGEGERFGNHTPWAEFNIYLDPESAQAIFSNPVLSSKTTLVTLDLTHQFLATQDIQSALLHGFDNNTPATTTTLSSAPPPDLTNVSLQRRLFHEIVTFFAKTYADVFGFTTGPPTHDPLAVAAILPSSDEEDEEDFFHDNGGERFSVTVITDGEHGASEHARGGKSQCGRTVAELVSAGECGVRIPREVESAEVWKLLERCLGEAERAAAAAAAAEKS